MRNKILITGAAGFIGYHLTKKLLNKEYNIIGFDNISSYYDISLKESRIKDLKKTIKDSSLFEFVKGDLKDEKEIKKLFKIHKPNIVIHLAAQAGVRYSITNPRSYLDSNLIGFFNIIESCRDNSINNFIYASSSSVYGGNTKTPFHENDPVDHQVSLYAATKRSNELISHVYSHLYKIPTTALRFFTVYGPWGRPDMAPMKFAKAIFSGKPIEIFNNGEMFRDFTYIDDVIESIIAIIDRPASPDKNFKYNNPKPSTSWAPSRIFNIGNQESVKLMDFIDILENEIGIKAIKVFKEMQQGDVEITSSSTKLLEDWTGFKPYTSLQDGVKKFIRWYKDYYKIYN